MKVSQHKKKKIKSEVQKMYWSFSARALSSTERTFPLTLKNNKTKYKIQSTG